MSVGQSDQLQKFVTSRTEYAAFLSPPEDKTSGRFEVAPETANTPPFRSSLPCLYLKTELSLLI